MALVLIVIGLSTTIYKPEIDNNNTIIFCNTGDANDIRPSDIGVKLSKYDFDGEVFDYKYFVKYSEEDFKKILYSCNREVAEAANPIYDSYQIQRIFEIQRDSTLTEEEKNIVFQKDIGALDDSYSYSRDSILNFYPQIFEVAPKYDWYDYIANYIIALLVTLAIFEVTKRTFYYVSIGKLFPKE